MRLFDEVLYICQRQKELHTDQHIQCRLTDAVRGALRTYVGSDACEPTCHVDNDLALAPLQVRDVELREEGRRCDVNLQDLEKGRIGEVERRVVRWILVDM